MTVPTFTLASVAFPAFTFLIFALPTSTYPTPSHHPSSN